MHICHFYTVSAPPLHACLMLHSPTEHCVITQYIWCCAHSQAGVPSNGKNIPLAGRARRGVLALLHCSMILAKVLCGILYKRWQRHCCYIIFFFFYCSFQTNIKAPFCFLKRLPYLEFAAFHYRFSLLISYVQLSESFIYHSFTADIDPHTPCPYTVMEVWKYNLSRHMYI